MIGRVCTLVGQRQACGGGMQTSLGHVLDRRDGGAGRLAPFAPVSSTGSARTCKDEEHACPSDKDWVPLLLQRWLLSLSLSSTAGRASRRRSTSACAHGRCTCPCPPSLCQVGVDRSRTHVWGFQAAGLHLPAAAMATGLVCTQLAGLTLPCKIHPTPCRRTARPLGERPAHRQRPRRHPSAGVRVGGTSGRP